MLDKLSVDKNGGFPDHLHRNFETATYMLESQKQHRDFTESDLGLETEVNALHNLLLPQDGANTVRIQKRMKKRILWC
ncbi:hypothetical protein K457DRAFT_23866 [Linnemannia elongata AG-77]|uniref:Uncharacterized protein n=1 Tax=Linnemannia elongata AG-77 TaxID=1314771 RepID=A0A197JJE4_9FUNG|nr:hypothetical protein K457DRAFT_23866 [Linnemannia elongata AG-77]